MNIKKIDNKIIVTDTDNLSKQFSRLHLEEKFTDVTIIVDNQRFAAHKIILAARSEYFEALLYGNMLESSKSEITVQDATPEAFEILLKYLYAGCFTVKTSETDMALNILELAHKFCIKDLQQSLIETLKVMLNIENVCSILKAANLFDLKDLIESCYSYLDNNGIELLTSDHFVELTQQSGVELLKRDSFFVPEIEIFKGVVKWCEINEDKDDLLVKCIRLTCLDVADIISIVWPSKLFKDYDLLQAISEIINVKPRKVQCRTKLLSDENVATPAKKATVIHGNGTDYLLTGNRNMNRHASCPIGDKNGVTIKFGELYIINHIFMSLYDGDERCYSYYIEVSRDQKTWKKVIDYTNCSCRSYQNLYFDKIAVQYVRIIGTHNSANSTFHLIFVEADCRKDIPDVANGIIRPISNVATLEKKAVVIQGYLPEYLLNGKTTGYSEDSGYTYSTNSASDIIIQLAQPYLISTMKLLLWDLDDRYYNYYIQTSVNKTNWEMVVDRRNEKCKSWQTLKFPEKPMVFIKLVGTYNSRHNGFQCVHFECSGGQG